MISSIVGMLIRLLELAIIAHVLLSYILSPYHPVRQTLSRIIEPFLAPIRRMLPSIGGLDLSPLILLLLLQFLGQLLVRWMVSAGL